MLAIDYSQTIYQKRNHCMTTITLREALKINLLKSSKVQIVKDGAPIFCCRGNGEIGERIILLLRRVLYIESCSLHDALPEIIANASFYVECEGWSGKRIDARQLERFIWKGRDLRSRLRYGEIWS